MEYESSKDLLEGLKEAREKKELQYLSVLKKDRNKEVTDIGKVEFEGIKEIIRNQKDILGIHLDFKNLKI